MVIGIDVGNTSTDVAIIDEKISTVKFPELGIEEVLNRLSRLVNLRNEKLVVSVSRLLNPILNRYHEISTLVLLIPGCGLNYSSYGKVLSGYVNHRGDVVEKIDIEEVKRAVNCKADNVAIVAKFSVRNPELELKLFEIAKNYFDGSTIALSHHIGELNFPLRMRTTIINAKVKKSIHRLTEVIKKYSDKFFYYRGDGGIVPYEMALRNPSMLFNSSSAAVATGAYYLTKEKNALVVDIGSTTTDFVVLENGKPKVVNAEIAGKKTLIRCADSFSIPFGGDSVVKNSILKPIRLSRAIAFGGKHFTLTDALNCSGFDIGNVKASREAAKHVKAEKIVEEYVSMVADVICRIEAKKIIGTGFLARYLIPAIARKANVDFVIPEHSEVANAIGAAVAKISLTLYARFDTEVGKAVYNGEVEKLEARSDEEIIELAMEKAKSMAMAYGASKQDLKTKLVHFSSYVIVRNGIEKGRIADVVVQIESGISSEFGEPV
jgi:N-methylhydantoinase A/oxoprolinase/acetone carboxylase beta subunit